MSQLRVAYRFGLLAIGVLVAACSNPSQSATSSSETNTQATASIDDQSTVGGECRGQGASLCQVCLIVFRDVNGADGRYLTMAPASSVTEYTAMCANMAASARSHSAQTYYWSVRGADALNRGLPDVFTMAQARDFTPLEAFLQNNFGASRVDL